MKLRLQDYFVYTYSLPHLLPHFSPLFWCFCEAVSVWYMKLIDVILYFYFPNGGFCYDSACCIPWLLVSNYERKWCVMWNLKFVLLHFVFRFVLSFFSSTLILSLFYCWFLRLSEMFVGSTFISIFREGASHMSNLKRWILCLEIHVWILCTFFCGFSTLVRWIAVRVLMVFILFFCFCVSIVMCMSLVAVIVFWWNEWELGVLFMDCSYPLTHLAHVSRLRDDTAKITSHQSLFALFLLNFSTKYTLIRW
jgi:hypothetical protein